MAEKKKRLISDEARARQLAGLSGVKVEDHVPGFVIAKANGKGPLATIPEDVRKLVCKLYLEGHIIRHIAATVNLSEDTVYNIKSYAMDTDPVFRETMHKQNMRERLRTMVSRSVERLDELMPEMSAKDAALAMGIGFDKLAALDRNNQPETLHQHVHLHGPNDIAKGLLDAMKPKHNDKETPGSSSL